MTRIIALVFIAQFIFLSQSAQIKRASDACPGNNDKSSTSNDYAYLSKRTSGDSDFSKPKYQSIYAKNTTTNTSVKRGRAIVKEEKTASQTTARTEKPTAPILKEEKSNPAKAITEPKEEDEFVQEASTDKKEETTKLHNFVEAEEVINTDTKAITKEEGKTASSSKDYAGTKKSEKVTSKSASTKSTDLKTTKVVKQKQQNKGTAKKLRLGKKCATDCPTF